MTQPLPAIFDRIHGKYELANHVITGCLDLYWRRRMMNQVKQLREGIWLDLCCGTGETTALLRRSAKGQTRVLGTDFTASMLGEAKKRVSDSDFLLSDAKALPFKDGSITLVTMAFATRNLALGASGLEAGLSEIHRVLEPGGLFLNLDTSQPQRGVVRSLAHLYTDRVARPLHGMITGSADGARYLAESVRGFLGVEELMGLLSRVGFTDIAYQHMFLGVAAVHAALKPGHRSRCLDKAINP